MASGNEGITVQDKTKNALDLDALTEIVGGARFEDPNATVITGTGEDDYICSGQGDTTIRAGDGNDTINDAGGNNVIDGGAGNDRVYGGDGNDRIAGGSGNDFLNGGDGKDNLDGGSGDDSLDGGPGDDILSGGEGRDVLMGGAGNDYLTGEGGSGDTLLGGDGNDHIIGHYGNDVIDGGLDDDRIYAGGGNDTIDGGWGADMMFAGDGNDMVKLTAGDTAYGETGDDTFVLSVLDGHVFNEGTLEVNGGSGHDRLLIKDVPEGGTWVLSYCPMPPGIGTGVWNVAGMTGTLTYMIRNVPVTVIMFSELEQIVWDGKEPPVTGRGR